MKFQSQIRLWLKPLIPSVLIFALLVGSPVLADDLPGGLYEHPSYGFNFVNYVGNSVENDGLFGWNVDSGVNLISQSVGAGTDSFMRISSNSSSWTMAYYNDFGYFQPNGTDFTVTMNLRIPNYLTSESSNSYLIVNIETGDSVLKLRLNKNGIQCSNSLNQWKTISTTTSNAYKTYALKVRDGKLQEAFINSSAQSFSPIVLPVSSNRLLELRVLGRSNSTNFIADFDEFFIYSMPNHINLLEAANASTNAGGTGDGTHFMHLGIGDDGIPVGVNANGGGYITQIYNQGDGVRIEDSQNLGPILDAQPQYGAGSNQSIRGQMHGNRFNPVQAGISKFIGHVADVTKLKKTGAVAVTSSATAKILVEQFPTYNDPTTEYAENLTYDFDVDGVSASYSGAVIDPEINDGINESAISATEEGITELDFCGYFQDVSIASDGRPTMLSYGEWKYIRPPCHILQLSRETGAISASLTPVQISTEPGRSILKTRDTDLGSMRVMREVRSNSDFGYTWVHWKENGAIRKGRLTGTIADKIPGEVSSYVFELFDTNSSNAKPDNNLVILAKSGNRNAAGAMGIYYPDTTVNQLGTVGYNRSTDAVVYQEDRRTSVQIQVDWRKLNWVRLRLYTFTRGLFSPSRVDDVYEGFRSENYTIFGTPNEIYDKVENLVQ